MRGTARNIFTTWVNHYTYKLFLPLFAQIILKVINRIKNCLSLKLVHKFDYPFKQIKYNKNSKNTKNHATYTKNNLYKKSQKFKTNQNTSRKNCKINTASV